jgi:putative toxin-antitoxin system antitoxin component (TIGR02293 family)
MAVDVEGIVPPGTGRTLHRVTELLGGAKLLGRCVTSSLDAHEMLLRGLPGLALDHLARQLTHIRPGSLEKALGMSSRTYQRRKDAPGKPLSKEQSGRAWTFVKILAKAMDTFGSQANAERWLERPAIGLDQRCPIDLLATPAGIELVEAYLTRLNYGVYA